MPLERSAWTRFWCRRAGVYSLDNRGYLADPLHQWGRITNPAAITFDGISAVPCLVLSGEPGAGKSDSISNTIEGIRRAEPRDHISGVIKIDLIGYQSDIRLHRAIFESSVSNEWRSTGKPLHLFLDGVDECTLGPSVLQSVLEEGFSGSSLENLYLRLACRTADWPQSLEDWLWTRWGKEQMQVHELLPLRRRDVAEVAKANGVTPERFLAAVEDADVVPLAIKPITLTFLLSSFRAEGRLPSTQKEL